MAWDDISKSLGTVIDDRLSNPLVSSVAISWVGWNYKFFFVLFAGDPVANKLFMLDALYPDAWTAFAKGIGAPVATAYAYLYLLPFASYPFFRKWRTNLKDFNGIKELVPIEEIITKTEKIALMEEQVKLQEQHDLLRTEIRSLKSQLGIAAAKTDDYDVLAKNNGKLAARVDELQNVAMRRDAELFSVTESLTTTRRRAREFEIRKMALDSYLATEGAQKDPLSIRLAIQAIERAISEFSGDEPPTLNHPRVNGVNFAEVVHDIARTLDNGDGTSAIKPAPF